MSLLVDNFSKNAIGIARRSDIKQKHNASIETQSEEIRLRATSEGFNIVEVFIDDANSAYHQVVTSRKAMTDLLEAALSEDLNIEAIFFYEESRVSRQFYDFTLFIHDVIKRDKPYMKFFSTCTFGEWDPYKVESIIKFATAASESVAKSRRAKDGQKNALSKKDRPGSKIPFGYKLHFPYLAETDENPNNIKGEQILHPDSARIVLFIFHLSSWGHSQQSIANLLNEAGITSPEGKVWSSGTIDYILDNDQYLGHLSWNIRVSRNTSRKKQRGEYDLIFNHHEPIISVHLWNITHQTIELHKRNGKNNSSPFLLRGLLHCQKCNQSLVSKNETPKNSKHSYLVYRCPSCKKKLILDEIHNEILKELSSKWYVMLENLEHTLAKLMTKGKSKIEEHRNSIKNQLQEITLNEEFLINDPEKVNQNSDWDFILSISKSKLNREIFKANTFIEHINLLTDGFHSNQIFTLLKLNNLQNPELRTLLLTLFKKIDVDFENGKLLYVDYKLAPFSEIDLYYESIKE
ncbi:resolvase-like protein [Psychrobacillus insolitus]|uniref:Resolvase-like protein n=1 Tax=Psychrobacillus insolitus TaxID=1461 RepID=A0A2W7PGM3_9BACI|nr:recombinase family protein [Psychrobacillus insolitus]PZX07406.1 resolvase-like protein [Psychrobacillus insolitus]